MTQRETIDTTYADLRPTDLVIDKSGQAWPLKELDESGGKVWFWLCDPVSKMKAHFIGKPSLDSVKVSRLPTQADEAAKLEADFPKSGSPASTTASATSSVETGATGSTETDSIIESAGVADNFATMAEAVAAVEEIGGTVEAEVTAQEVDAAAAATEDAPVTLPLFEDMTPLERRSHLYLLHGIYATDVRSNDELIEMHNNAGTVQSKTVPHVHKASA